MDFIPAPSNRAKAAMDITAQEGSARCFENPECRHSKDALNILRYIQEDKVPGHITVLWPVR